MMDESVLLKSQVTIRKQLNPHFSGSPAVAGESIPTSECSVTPEVDLSDGEDEPWERGGANVVAKRNARERTRVHTVNQAFLVLKCHLPSLRSHTKRVSKLKILKAAICYIDTLDDILKSSSSTILSLPSRPLPRFRKPRESATQTKKVTSSTPLSDRSLVTQAPPPFPPYLGMPSLLDYPPYLYPSPFASGSTSFPTISSAPFPTINPVSFSTISSAPFPTPSSAPFPTTSSAPFTTLSTAPFSSASSAPNTTVLLTRTSYEA